jgi:hypothetical protein
MVTQSPEQAMPSEAGDVITESMELTVPEINHMDMGSMQSPSIKDMDVSTTTTEELSRIRPDISKRSSRLSFIDLIQFRQRY